MAIEPSVPEGVALSAPSTRSKPARIKDVAARAGVSLKTVTNVVHERPYVRADTRARVQEAIDALGYRPSLAGRQLQSGRSRMVTLAVPRIDEPYLAGLAHACIEVATARGYTVLIDETRGEADREALAASGYPGHGFDGVIFSPLALDPAHLALQSRNTPMVLLGEHLPDSPADYVAIDNVQSARDVVAHLLAGGRRNIGYVGYQPTRPASVGTLRCEGYRQQLADASVHPAGDLLVPTQRYTREQGEACVDAVVAAGTPLDALVCASDLLAIGALRALRRHGCRVPDDVAVVGWDNIVDGQYAFPSLSTVAPDMTRLAELALTALISRIDGDRSPGVSYVVPHELVVRESSETR